MSSRDNLRGTLEVLILKTLAWGPRHGYAIARWLEDTSDEALRVEEGSLYPALYRLEKRGWLKADRRMSELGRPAKFYQLTQTGRRHLQVETREWLAFSRAVTRVLEATP